jgi:hypothetical protein
MGMVLLLLLAAPLSDPISLLARERFRIFDFPRALIAVADADEAHERAQVLADRFGAVLGEVEARLGLRSDFRVILAECSLTSTFQKLVADLAGTAPPRYAVAVAVPALATIVIDRSSFQVLAGPQPRSTLAHEVAHLLLHRRFTAIPRWLDEGLAMWASEQTIGLHEDQLLCYWARRHGTYPFGELERAFPREHQLAAFAYVQSYRLVTYLVEYRGGLEKTFALLGRLEREPVRQSWQEVYGEEPEATAEAWRRFEARRFRPLVFLLYEIPAFSLPGILFLVAYIRYRFKRSRYFREEARAMPDEEPANGAPFGPEEDSADAEGGPPRPPGGT